MVMTVLEARVPNERLAEVEPLFSLGTAQLPPEILATYLVRDADEPTLFRLNTVWRTREALEA
ncbi:MAG: antibiotic biosynthesis monooxygenase, partial [Acidobacteriia bacterium]|nr:antibiotic biosynthesis monooxygenase [Terriglobia bacterium]